MGLLRRDAIPEMISRDWLDRVGASPEDVASIIAEVGDRLRYLPAPLRALSVVADGSLAVLPAAVCRRAIALPGVSEYARLVRSLTAVAYYDRLESAQAGP